MFLSECGRPVMINRIVGGSSASEGAWPWQVDIQVRMAAIMKEKFWKTESEFTGFSYVEYIPAARSNNTGIIV